MLVYDLLHFARWWQQHPSYTLLEMNESTLLDYVRDQLDEEPQPTPETINHRLTVLRSLYRFHSGHPLPPWSHTVRELREWICPAPPGDADTSTRCIDSMPHVGN